MRAWRRGYVEQGQRRLRPSAVWRNGVLQLGIDDVAADLIERGVVPGKVVLDGSLSVVDMSSRNQNFRASWLDSEAGSTGVILKFPDPSSPGSEASLRNEASFYAACARLRSESYLAIPAPLPDLVQPPGLALRLVRDAVTLTEFRKNNSDFVGAHAALGDALGAFHRFGESDETRKDVYAQQLSDRVPWVLSAHRPSLDDLPELGQGRIGFLKILQRETELCTFLDRLATEWNASTIVHADLRADNILVGSNAAEPSVTIIDWELARRGNPAWDIGAVFQDLLASWLLSLTPSAEKDMQTLLGEADAPIRALQPSFRAFWSSYAKAAALPSARRDERLVASVRASVAFFVQRACELAWNAPATPNHTVTMLQLAANIARSPAKASLFLYGLPIAVSGRKVP